MIARCRLRLSFAGSSALQRRFYTALEETEVPSEVLSPSKEKKTGNEKQLYRMLCGVGGACGTVSQTLNHYVREGNLPKKVELEWCIRQLRNYGKYQLALQVMEWMKKRDINFSDTDVAVHLDLISKTHGIAAAESFFNGLSSQLRTRNTYGSLLNCYCKLKMEEKALALFDEIESKKFTTSLSFNNLMTLYIGLNQPEKVPSLVQEMKSRNIQLSTFTYNIWMDSLSRLGDIEGAERVFDEITKERKEICNWSTYSNIASVYVKAGLREKAESALKMLENKLGHPSLEAYKFLIGYYASLGNQDEVRRIWQVLKRKKKTVSNTSYLVMLQALAKLEDLDGLRKCFLEWELSCTSYDIKLANVLINAYLRRGMIEEADQIFNKSAVRASGPFQTTLALFMKYYLESKQMDLALECLEKAVAQAESRKWHPPSDSVDLFMKYFEEERDVDSAEHLCKILKRLNCLDGKLYGQLLQTYIAAGKTDPGVRKRIGGDGILMSSELEDMLKKVCPE